MNSRSSFHFLPLLLVLTTLSAPRPAHAQPTTSSARVAPGLTLIFEAAPFIPEEHEVAEDENTGLVIDGCEAFFGTDNAMPTQYLREAHVRFEGHWYALDTSCMYACEFCAFDAADVEVSPNPGGAGYRLEGSFSDGAGAYYATWLVTPKGTARTRIVSGPAAAHRHRIDTVIDQLRALQGALETGTASPAEAAERIQDLADRLDLIQLTNSER